MILIANFGIFKFYPFLSSEYFKEITYSHIQNIKPVSSALEENA